MVAHGTTSALAPVMRKAMNGDAKAQCMVGEAYMASKAALDREHLVTKDGKFHTDPNPGEAARWFARAAVQGHVGAQFALGRICEGRGDEAEAQRWFDRADQGGHDIARQRREARAKRTCTNCGKFDTSCKVCAACRSVAFCSQACQRKFWPTHKSECRRLVAAAAAAAAAVEGKASALAAADDGIDDDAPIRDSTRPVVCDQGTLVQLEKEKGDAAFRDGNMEFALDHYSSAVDIFEALASEPSEDSKHLGMFVAALFCNRSLACHKLSRFTEALADANRAQELHPMFLRAHLRAAAALEALGRKEAAAARRRTAAELTNEKERLRAGVRVAALGYTLVDEDDIFRDLAGGRDPLDLVVGRLETSKKAKMKANLTLSYDEVYAICQRLEDPYLARALRLYFIDAAIRAQARKYARAGDKKMAAAHLLSLAAAYARLARDGPTALAKVQGNAVLKVLCGGDHFTPRALHAAAISIISEIEERLASNDDDEYLRQLAWEIACRAPQMDPHGSCHSNLGNICRNCDQYKNAAALWEIAASRGCGDAMGELGRILVVGAPGVPIDRDRAYELLQRARATIGTDNECCKYRITHLEKIVNSALSVDAGAVGSATFLNFYGEGRHATIRKVS